jgi:non-ribosomal peptide synthetase component E (peptide arylation enzyme)
MEAEEAPIFLSSRGSTGDTKLIPNARKNTVINIATSPRFIPLFLSLSEEKGNLKNSGFI